MKFTFELPPTTNATYKVGKGHMYRSKEAEEWTRTAYYTIKEKGIKEILKTTVRVDIKMYVKNDRDIDSSLKTTLDVLQKAGVIENDKQITQLVVIKIRDINKPRLEVAIDTI